METIDSEMGCYGIAMGAVGQNERQPAQSDMRVCRRRKTTRERHNIRYIYTRLLVHLAAIARILRARLRNVPRSAARGFEGQLCVALTAFS